MSTLLQQESGLLEKEHPQKALDCVTIAITTYNRASMLKEAISSALAQDYPNIQILVLDNASTDETASVVTSFDNKKIVYLPSEVNIGMLNNFNRAFVESTNPFIVILQDDDILLPGFISQSVALLNKYPTAGFSYTLARHIDAQGVPGTLQPKPNITNECISGLDFLHMTVQVSDYGAVYCSAVLMRASALKEAGVFDSPHATHTFDLNLYFRLASRFDVVHVPKELVYVRFHSGQEGYAHYESASGTGFLGSNAERIDALAYLLKSERATDANYREWLSQRLLTLNAQQSAYAHPLLPDMYWTWQERLEIAKREISYIIPQGETFILADEEQWATGGKIAGRQALAFNTKDGIYWGPPADDEAAIAELKRLQKQGLKYIVFGWPAFWWLEHYSRFHQYLRSTARLITKNTRLIAFQL